MINLHESIGRGRDQTRDRWICSQTRYCLRYAAWHALTVLKPYSKALEISLKPDTQLKTGDLECLNIKVFAL